MLSPAFCVNRARLERILVHPAGRFSFQKADSVFSENNLKRFRFMPSKKIVIIGAGPAGLTAGCKLLRANKECRVLILEECDVAGGLSRTVLHNGNRMDIGGHRFFSKDRDVNALWEEWMPLQGKPALDDKLLGRETNLSPNGPDPEKEDRVMLSRKRVSRIYYKQHFFDYPIRMCADTFLNMGLGTTFVAGMSYLKSAMRKLPENSLENFYVNRFGRKLYSMFFEGYTEKLWGRHPRAISADWGAQRVKGLSILAVFADVFRKLLPGRATDAGKVETSLIGEFHYPKFGPGQLWETVADEIRKMGGEILFNHKVVAVKKENGLVKAVVCRTEKGLITLDCDIVISSMPLKDMVGGMNDVPPEIAAIAAGLPYRDFVTVGVLIRKLALKNETKLKTLQNLIPDCWIYVQDTGVKLGRIQIFNNWSPYMVKDPENTVCLGLEYFCCEGDELWTMDDETWKERCVSELVTIGVLNPAEPVLDWHVEKVRKAYPAYFDTYERIGELVDYLNSIGNLYCIGRNGQHRYNNMDHSMVTAFEAVKCILGEASEDKSSIWSVNTEKEYREE